MSTHKARFTEEQLPLLLNISRQAVTQFSTDDCPLCEPQDLDRKTRQLNSDIPVDSRIVFTPKQFYSHLGSHMKGLSLFAISSSTLWEDMDTEDEGEPNETDLVKIPEDGLPRHDKLQLKGRDISDLSDSEIQDRLRKAEEDWMECRRKQRNELDTDVEDLKKIYDTFKEEWDRRNLVAQMDSESSSEDEVEDSGIEPREDDTVLQDLDATLEDTNEPEIYRTEIPELNDEVSSQFTEPILESSPIVPPYNPTIQIYSSKESDWVPVKATLDTGTSENWISTETATRLGLKVKEMSSRTYHSFTGDTVESSQGVDNVTWHGLGSSRTHSTQFRIAPENAPFDILVGSELIFSENLLAPRPVSESGSGTRSPPFQGTSGAEATRQPSNHPSSPQKQEVFQMASTPMTNTDLFKDRLNGWFLHFSFLEHKS
jgi:hypothetical protein